MRLKIPPALVAFISGFMMWGMDHFVHLEMFAFSAPPLIYKAFFGVAVLCAVLAMIQFARHKTTIDPHRIDKAGTLVSSGIYGYSRNPMYLAMLIVLMGFVFKLGSFISFLLIPFFIIYMNRFQIIPEEEMLAAKFSEEFEAYKSRVRRWL